MPDPWQMMGMALASSERARKAAKVLAEKVGKIFTPEEDVQGLVDFLKGKTEEVRQQQRLPGMFDVMPRTQKFVADLAIDTLGESTTKGGQATGIELPFGGAMAGAAGGKKLAKAVQGELLDPTIYPDAQKLKEFHRKMQNLGQMREDRVTGGAASDAARDLYGKAMEQELGFKPVKNQPLPASSKLPDGDELDSLPSRRPFEDQLGPEGPMDRPGSVDPSRPWDPPKGFRESLENQGRGIDDIDDPLKRAPIANAAEISKMLGDLQDLQSTDPEKFNKVLHFGGFDSLDDFLQADPIEQKQAINDMRSLLSDDLPPGFGETGKISEFGALAMKRDQWWGFLKDLENTHPDIYERAMGHAQMVGKDDLDKLDDAGDLNMLLDDLTDFFKHNAEDLPDDLPPAPWWPKEPPEWKSSGTMSIYHPPGPSEAENLLQREVASHPFYGPKPDELPVTNLNSMMNLDGYQGNEFGGNFLQHAIDDELPFGTRNKRTSAIAQPNRDGHLAPIYRFQDDVQWHDDNIAADVRALQRGDTDVFMQKSGTSTKPFSAESNPFKDIFWKKKPEEPKPSPWPDGPERQHQDLDLAEQRLLKDPDDPYDFQRRGIEISGNQYKAENATSGVLSDLSHELITKEISPEAAEPLFRRGIFNLMEQPTTEAQRESWMGLYNSHFGPNPFKFPDEHQRSLPNTWRDMNEIGVLHASQQQRAEEALQAALKMPTSDPYRETLMKRSIFGK